MKKIPGLLLLLILFFLQKAWAVTSADTLHLEFKNTVDNEQLELGKTYTNYFNEPFTIRSFKYYISNIQLLDEEGNIVLTNNNVFLVNEADEASMHIALATPKTKWRKIRFLLGVDSIRNTGGVQTGDLDPAKGMFWVWNTGYIMAKMEGNSPVSRAPAHAFTFDVGGYKKGENTARIIELNVPENNSAALTIVANAAKWFNGTHDIRIAEHPFCHAAGALAVQIADNYSTMFSIRTQ